MKETKEMNFENMSVSVNAPSAEAKKNFIKELMRLYYKYNSKNKKIV